MQYDDRLATVLRLRPESEALARIQYRQLLDLLGTSPAAANSPQVEAAYDRLADLSAAIPAAGRSAMLGELGQRLRAPRLVAALASDEPAVATAAIRRADLAEEQWLDLIPALPVAARGAMRLRRDLGPRVVARMAQLGIHDRALPTSAEAETIATNDNGIGAIVRRIEAYRRARSDAESSQATDAPRLPLGEDHVLTVSPQVRAFDFATDPAGRIVWADPGVAAMVLGQPLLARRSLGGGEAFTRRQPIRAARVALDGASAIAGAWQLDAAPSFEPLTGAFTGYLGRLRRPARADAATTAPRGSGESDTIRQLLHELKTPINAIQGFAEVIQQQLFGPTPHEYRALAASIASDAARILAGFEELERFARLESAALAIEPGESDLAHAVRATVERLAAFTGARGSGFDARAKGDELHVALAPAETERLVWRLLAALAGAAAPGEVLPLRLKAISGRVRLKVALPAVLAARDEAAMFGAGASAVPQAISSGMFGTGFALRLTRAEARAAGGSLARVDNDLRLTLPGLTTATGDHSQAAG